MGIIALGDILQCLHSLSIVFDWFCMMEFHNAVTRAPKYAHVEWLCYYLT